MFKYCEDIDTFIYFLLFAGGLKTRVANSILTELGYDLLNKFLTYNPVTRVTADEALRHDYFTESPLPIDPAMFPTWPAKSELAHKKASMASPKPPSGGHNYKQLVSGIFEPLYVAIPKTNV